MFLNKTAHLETQLLIALFILSSNSSTHAFPFHRTSHLESK
jgi:hypothetical protein